MVRMKVAGFGINQRTGCPWAGHFEGGGGSSSQVCNCRWLWASEPSADVGFSQWLFYEQKRA